MHPALAHARRTFLLLRLLAAAAALALAAVPPAVLWQTTCQSVTARIGTQAAITANDISQFVVRRPDLWPYETVRLTDVMARHTEDDEYAVLSDLSGTVLTSIGTRSAKYYLDVSKAVTDAGVPVGHLTISAPVDGLIIQVLSLGAICALLGGLCYALFVRVPIAALARLTQELYHEKERVRTTLSSIGDAVIAIDRNGRVQYMNPMARQLTGTSEEGSMGAALSDVLCLVNERTGRPAPNPLSQAISERHTVVVSDHLTLHGASGNVSVESTAAPIIDDESHVIGGVIVLHDVGDNRRLANQLEWQATHDLLTGLPNRSLFGRKVQQALAEANSGVEAALCMMDLDQFKIVNDTCGHQAGDELLKQLTALISQRIRRSDLLARLGGDEFGLLLTNCTLTQAEAVANQVLDTVKGFRFMWEGRAFTIGVSIGVVPLTGVEVLDRVMSAADAACYAAKELGRGRVQLYHLHDEELAARHAEMAWGVRITKAMDENRLVLFSQPYRALRPDAEEGHAEILVRLVEPDGSLIAPGAFIPAAERYNLMTRLDKHIVALAFQSYAELRSDEVWALNLSGGTLAEPTLCDFIEDAVCQYKLDPARFCFEITETAAISNLGSGLRAIERLRACGFSIALDDFGQGFSSFSYLSTLPVEYLKIDGEYVRDMGRNPVHHVVVKALNEISHSFGLKTIAEYVEDPETVGQLREIGVDYAQGFAIARPCPLPTRHTLDLGERFGGSWLRSTDRVAATEVL